MIKVKKSLALLIIAFLILSNVVFAPSHPYYSDDSSYYEGKPIDPSKEGKEYYREGNVIVYPAKMGSDEERMMERFMKGDLGEDEMRAMAKSKLGDEFDEIKFQKGVMEFKERMERKEAFFYENEGYALKYDAGPSYEGYSKEHMVFGMVFQHIGDEIDPREIKLQCNEPEKIADITISKLKEKVGDLQQLCSQAEEHETKCLEFAKKGCSQLRTSYVRDDATELEKLQSIAYSCPVNTDAIIKACVLRSKANVEQNIKHATESCEKMFKHEGERFLIECERFKENQICDRERYIEKCMGEIKKEDFEKPICPAYPVPTCSEDTQLKIKTDTNGCEYYYCEAIQQCPTQAAPQCAEGTTLQKKVDEKGCVYYYCETTNLCPPQTLPTCREDETIQKKVDEKGCLSYYCQTTTTCPEPITPTCSAGQILQKKTDDRGCVYYYCEAAICPSTQKPSCAADEHLQTNYDNAGCVASYQCIRLQTTTTCPPVPQTPICAEGQSLTTKHDEKGCIVGYECVTITSTSGTAITGQAVLNTYDDFLRQCENSWKEQERVCATMLESCDKDALIERCKQQSRKNYEDYSLRIEQHCKLYIDTEIRAAEDRCSRIDEERKRCFDESTKRCEHMKGVAQKCRETLTEENLRKFIIEEAKKRCKFTSIVADEDDVRQADKVEVVLAVLNTATQADIEKLELFIDDLEEELKLQDTTVYKGTISPNSFGDVKLLPFVVNAKISTVISSGRAKEVKEAIVASQRIEEAAAKLASLRDSNVPSEYLYIIEDKASEVLDASDELKEIEKKEEERGFGYAIRRFFGLAKQIEEEEITKLEGGNEKLTKSVEVLTKLIDEVPSDVVKAVLKEQVESLKSQQQDIDSLIKDKQKKAKGLFGVFG